MPAKVLINIRKHNILPFEYRF